MAHNQDSLRDLVRQRLQADKIKLWLPPFTLADGHSPGTYAPDMVDRYSEVCGAAQEEIVATLESLRCHAIEKLSLRRAGVQAASRIEVGEQVVIKIVKNESSPAVVKITVNLEVKASVAYDLVAKEGQMPSDSFRLIFSGNVLDHSKTLHQQGVCGGSVLMALPLSVEEQKELKTAAAEQSASRVRDVAASLANREDDGEGRYVEICDQTGRPIDMPDGERRSLTLALTLHQKGKHLLHFGTSEQDYHQALALLRECDREFQQCRSSILELVDNYALLCLDICWCQLLLRDTAGLPEAQHRLAQCEQTLRKTYGRNLERLSLHKRGKTGAEKLLFGRLHLLQAVVAHFTGCPGSAKELLDRATVEFKSLKVNSESMATLLAMTGCSEESARVALRACGHDVQQAALELIEKVEEKARNKELLDAKSAKRRRGRTLGRTADDSSWIDCDKYDYLCSMEFPKMLCKIALKQCNNDLSAALSALQEKRDVLEAAAVDSYHQHTAKAGSEVDSEDADPPDDLVQQGVAMGFDAETIRAGLKHFRMQLPALVDHLLSHGSTGTALFCEPPGDADDALVAAMMFDPEMVEVDSNARRRRGPKRSRRQQEEEEDAAIERDIVPDLSADGGIDYLDSTLEQEMAILSEYDVIIRSS